jgi:hypothetical protein
LSEQEAGGSTDRDPKPDDEKRPTGDVQEDYPKGQDDEPVSDD